MKFQLNNEARKISEKSVGMTCSQQKSTRLGVFGATNNSSNKNETNIRQIKPRGSVYLQLGRKISISKIEKIIASL